MHKTIGLHRQWIYGALIPAIYLIVELSFNHQLIEVSAETVGDDVLTGLEFWGRVISGVGLGLAIYKLPYFQRIKRLSRLLLCLTLGVLTMWNVQKELTDYLVESASVEDKRAAIGLSALALPAAEGKLTTFAGDRLLLEDIDSFQEKATMALFPAAALHISPRDEQIRHWLAEVYLEPTGEEQSVISPEVAYRNLIVPPIAIGLSIFFALFNLALLVGFLLRRFSAGAKNLVVVALFPFLIAISAQQAGPFLGSPGYLNAMRDNLWERKPLLALLVEWSGRAAPAWGIISAFSHRFLLLEYDFKKPY